MSKFNTTTQKLRKLWEKVFKNTTDLTNVDNIDQIPFFSKLSQQQINKKIIQFYNPSFSVATIGTPTDASFTTKDANNNTLTTSAIENTELPQPYSYQEDINLELPEELLPFIKIIPEVKNPPSHILTLGGKFTSSRFDGDSDIIQIKGDASLLFQGTPDTIQANVVLSNNILNEFTEEELNTYNIPIANTKKVYNIEILYTLSGKDYSINGRVTDIQATYNTSFTCNQEADVYNGNFFQEGVVGSERHDNEILSLTDTQFSMKARKTEIRYVDVPPCTLNTTITNGVTKTGLFSATTSYSISVFGAWRNITDNIFLGNNQTVTVDTASATITSQTVTFIGYRPYYDNAKQGILSTTDTGNDDGDFDEYELTVGNLPNTNDGHTLTYTEISFLRSPDTTIISTDEYIQHSKNKLPVFFKKSESSFFTVISGDFLLKSPALVPDINAREFPVYDDRYTQTATTYTRTTENHSLTTPTIYTPQLTDAQIKLRLFLQNPMYWKENRIYDI